MNVPFYMLAATAASPQGTQIGYIWRNATPEVKIIIVLLVFFSVFAWSVMFAKVLQMRKAKKLNHFFCTEFRAQTNALEIFDRRIHVEGCPLFAVYQQGCTEMDTRLKNPDGSGRKPNITMKGM